MPLTFKVDEGFLRRTFHTSLVLSVFISLWALAIGSWPWIWGLLSGMAISLIFFKLLWSTFTAVVEKKKGSLWLLLLNLIKYPLLGIALFYLFKKVDANPLALGAGASLVPGVMVLKVIGILITERLEASRVHFKGKEEER